MNGCAVQPVKQMTCHEAVDEVCQRQAALRRRLHSQGSTRQAHSGADVMSCQRATQHDHTPSTYCEILDSMDRAGTGTCCAPGTASTR